jgi:AraC-like DNA-binding protein
MNRSDIRFHEAKNIGAKLPFACVDAQTLKANDDLFHPSLRDFHVIFWLRQGKVTYYVDFETYHLEAGSIVLVSKDSLHYFEPFADDVDIISIPFVPEFIYRTATDLEHLSLFETGTHLEGIQVLQIEAEQDTWLAHILAQMKTVYASWEGNSQADAFYHLLNLFFIQLKSLPHTNEEHNTRGPQQNGLLHQFNNLLNQHFATHFDVLFYVQHLGTSVKALSRAMHARYGLSTKGVIDKRRVLEMKRMLRGTNLSIKEIAFALGFDEPTNMVKFFKKHVGVTPLTFRAEKTN